MNIVKVGEDRYINVDRMTHVEPKRKGRLRVHFAVGEGSGHGNLYSELEADEAATFTRWLDLHSQDSQG